MERLLNEYEVSEMLAIKVKRLRAWRLKGGMIPFVKIGKSVRYRPQDVRQFVEQGQRDNTAQNAA